jgi:glycosyltransferase involved in cell wall biosynthesis
MYYSDEISVRRASVVATVSEISRRDILSVWRMPKEKVVVPGEGIEDRFFRGVSERQMARVRQKYGLRAAFLFYLGGLDPRKDVTTLVEAYARWGRRDVACVLCGSTRGELSEVQQAIVRHELEASVRILGEVDDKDIPALYAASACFVYPSRYEGFGLQAAEAMALGVPLIVSDGGALPEVTGDAALVFRVGDVGGLRDCLDRMFDDAALREALLARGKKRVEQFRWEHVVGNYLRLYRELSN